MDGQNQEDTRRPVCTNDTDLTESDLESSPTELLQRNNANEGDEPTLASPKDISLREDDNHSIDGGDDDLTLIPHKDSSLTEDDNDSIGEVDDDNTILAPLKDTSLTAGDNDSINKGDDDYSLASQKGTSFTENDSNTIGDDDNTKSGPTERR